MTAQILAVLLLILSATGWSAETLADKNPHLLAFPDRIMALDADAFRACYRDNIRNSGEQNAWTTNVTSARSALISLGALTAKDVTVAILDVEKSGRSDLVGTEFKQVLSLKLPKKTLEVALVEEAGKLFIAER